MYNLATTAGAQAFEDEYEIFASLYSAEAYFAKGKYGLRFNSHPVLVVDGDGDWDATFIAVYKGMLLRKWVLALVSVLVSV